MLLIAARNFWPSELLSAIVCRPVTTILEEVMKATFDDTLAEGISLLEAGDASGAVSAFQRCLALEPENPEGYFNLGEALVAGEKFEEAVKIYSDGLKLAPNDTEALTGLGDIYFEMGRFFIKNEDYDMAINALSKAIELGPNYPLLYDKRGIAFGHKEQYDMALADFNTAILIDPDFTGAYCNRGLSYYGQGMYVKAILDFNTAIELKPDVALFYSNRGLAYSELEKHSEALMDFDKAISLGMNDPFINTYREEEYAAIGKSDDDPIQELIDSVYYEGIENVEMENEHPDEIDDEYDDYDAEYNDDDLDYLTDAARSNKMISKWSLLISEMRKLLKGH